MKSYLHGVNSKFALVCELCIVFEFKVMIDSVIVIVIVEHVVWKLKLRSCVETSSNGCGECSFLSFIYY